MFVQLMLLFCVLREVKCYNILGIFPHGGKSHFDVFQPLLTELSHRGHNITMISYFPLPDNDNYTHVDLREKNSHILLNNLDLNLIVNRTRAFKYFGALPLVQFAQETCETLGSEKIQSFLQNEQDFDLIIIEMFTTDCYLGVVHRLQAPFIGVSSSVIMPWMNDRFGNIDHPAYIPVMFMDYSDRMSFLQRLENTLALLLNKFIHRAVYGVLGHNAAKKYISPDMPYLEDIARNSSLFLVNSHFSLNRPRPLVPGVVEISGMHLKEPKQIPENLEYYINNAKNGVIYFSMGSMIKAHTFPTEKREAFLRAFAKLNQRVLWKWENETLLNKPDNVMIQKWMPQFDILCHPNVVAFISHGGLLGTTEAVHCGVPLIVMPQYGDQFTNAKAIEANKAGVILNFADVTEDSVLNALNAVLQPSIQNRAKELSAIYRDRPMSPLDTAVYWVEYVARHKGAPHMRTAAVDMPFYQYLLLDVIVFLLIVVSVFFICIYYLLKFIKNALCGNNGKQKVL